MPRKTKKTAGPKKELKGKKVAIKKGPNKQIQARGTKWYK